MRKNQIQIDTTKLKVGQVVKNYKEMCAILGDEALKNGHDSKEAQLDYWSRFFDWQRDGQKYIITNIYDSPLPEMLPNSAVYAKFMQLILMDFLAKTPDGCYRFFTMPLMKLVGMTTPNYVKLREGPEKLEEMFGIYGEVDNTISCMGAEQMTRISYNRLLRILDDALKSLRKHAIIDFEREWAVKEAPWGIKGGFRRAKEEEIPIIVKAESAALEKIGTTNLWYARACRGHEMQTYMSEYIHEALPDLYGAIRWIVIVNGKPSDIYRERVVRKIIDELKQIDPSIEMLDLTDDILTRTSKKALNNLVIDAMMHEVDKEVAKAKEKVEKEQRTGKIIKYNRDETLHIASADFMREFTSLVNRYISIKDSTKKYFEARKIYDEDIDLLFD